MCCCVVFGPLMWACIISCFHFDPKLSCQGWCRYTLVLYQCLVKDGVVLFATKPLTVFILFFFLCGGNMLIYIIETDVKEKAMSWLIMLARRIWWSIDVRVTDDVVLIWEWRICCGWDCSCTWSGIRYQIVFSMWIKHILVLAFEGRCGDAWRKLIKRSRVMFAQCLWLRSLTWILKKLERTQMSSVLSYG